MKFENLAIIAGAAAVAYVLFKGKQWTGAIEAFAPVKYQQYPSQFSNADKTGDGLIYL